MLDTSTPFPHARSYCLWGADPEQARQEPQLARIEHWLDGDTAVVSLPLLEGAKGNRRVDRAELLDATPLSAPEARELDDLAARQTAFARGRGKALTKKQRDRGAQLIDMQGRAAILKGLLEQLGRQQRAMSRAA